jgi:protein FAM161A
MEDAINRIQGMWKDFSVDDYAPRRSTRKRSNSLSRLSTARSTSAERLQLQEETWSPKITIPKPFKMTLRDAKKTPKKTKAMMELEEQRQKELKAQESECQKKFKATPIPAHVYLPLYDQIMEEKETRRRMNKKTCADLIMSSIKPFKFSEREDEKKQIRHSKHEAMWRDNESLSPSFRAKPFPSHLFQSLTEDQMKEEEEYRRIRVQMRAEEMLRSASLPPNMKARGNEYTMGKERSKRHTQRAIEAGLLVEPEFSPKVNEAIPDFEELHKKFQKSLSKKKFNKEATVCKPFNLRTTSVATSKSRVYNDSILSDDMTKENVRPYSRPKSATLRSSEQSQIDVCQGFNLLSLFAAALSSSMDSIPTKMTTAAELRQSNLK